MYRELVGFESINTNHVRSVCVIINGDIYRDLVTEIHVLCL